MGINVVQCIPILRAVGEPLAQRCAAMAPKEVCEAITPSQLSFMLWGMAGAKRQKNGPVSKDANWAIIVSCQPSRIIVAMFVGKRPIEV